MAWSFSASRKPAEPGFGLSNLSPDTIPGGGENDGDGDGGIARVHALTPEGERALIRRRDRLVGARNPGRRHDYVVTLTGRLAVAGAPLRVVLRYVPDRMVLPTDAFAAYIEELGAGDWTSVEALAVAMVEDLNSELIPRWLRVSLIAEGTGADRDDGAAGYRVDVEDRQPNWDNPSLLARLAPATG